ncbi:phosphoribosylaminoimidazole carboxylase [Dissoconium aciculare CBS 342.82]|uniref:Phosphoribosylaminoimidazole carboxylase n=1 Tax=Dissoconium aciculare CBS 342.82 TaxID=1314786 RepID=A0A6J3M1I0_9PEZI|nr:phosphoribosylaminoimidazole carboxylase [Dissoconium aciculare CBS 342.82]KAF1820772.1 phosphoribosylaminoimidazole carboxylase [Dissoconium aciculare CBS 342.82]
MASDRTVGLLGGGQLGRMLLQAANLLEIKVNILDAAGSSAKQISAHDGHIAGSFKDRDAIRALARTSDVLTVEIEHVDTYILEEVARDLGVDVQPAWSTLRTIQDKFLQKGHLLERGVATAESLALAEPSRAELERVSAELGLPLMLKSRREAYDGRGNFPVRTADDFDAALQALSGRSAQGGLQPGDVLYAEKWANFRMELAVMVVKTKDQVLSYPTVETIHEDSICKLTYAPARRVSSATNERAQALARQAVACFAGKGVFGVEMFLLPDDTLLINEIAPRPHNSGHYTIEACPVSQYEAHLRAILDLPLLAEDLELREPSIMLNILGGAGPDSHIRIAREALRQRRTKVHLYGKGEARKGRKMGHITICASTMAEAEAILAPTLALVDGTATPQSSHGSESPSKPSPLVAVVMGSDSDLPVLEPGLKLLTQLGIPHTVRITSAHRTPAHMAEFARDAAASGIRVLIGAAGGAAHLPGMAAAHTWLPVIGVPVKPSIGDGTDSVLSILNMPRGVPVATVAINNAVNAALLAARILAAGTDAAALRARDAVRAYAADSTDEVMGKDARLERIGWKDYLEGMRAK